MNGRIVDDGTGKRPRPFVFDVFAEDDYDSGYRHEKLFPGPPR